MKWTWLMWVLRLMAWCLPQLTAAQGYPNWPVKIVAPFAAGRDSDIVGRPFAEELHRRFDQSSVIDNEPGGSARIAAAGIQPERRGMMASISDAAFTQAVPYA